ncbi:hypothetical protein GOODEAATRI_028906, partial [Goodea atripinnis]
KFNHGVSVDIKKQKWAEITDQINSLGENHREIRQIMKKWADLKCDGQRRLLAMRGPNGSTLRKKRLGPVERMVHKILMMSPKRDEESDQDLSLEEDFAKSFLKGPLLNVPPYSYLNLNENSEANREAFSFDMSPLSSPEKELDELVHSSSEFDQADDEAPSFKGLLPGDTRERIKPVHTYSRTHQNQNHTQNSTNSPPTSSISSFPSDAASSSFSCAAPPPSASPPGSSMTPSLLLAPSSSTSVTTNGAPPPKAISSSAIAPSSSASSSFNIPPPPPSSSNLPHSHASTSNPSVLLPPGSSLRRSQEQVAQLASQSLQQQRAGRMLLTSVSQSLEMLTQSMQLLVESQQEFVQESLQLQRETVDVLRDFSNTTLHMLRDKSNTGQLLSRHPAPAAPPAPPAYHHQHPASRF